MPKTEPLYAQNTPAGKESFRTGPHSLNDERSRNSWGTGEMFIKQRVFPRKQPCAPHIAVLGTIHRPPGIAFSFSMLFCVPYQSEKAIRPTPPKESGTRCSICPRAPCRPIVGAPTSANTFREERLQDCIETGQPRWNVFLSIVAVFLSHSIEPRASGKRRYSPCPSRLALRCQAICRKCCKGNMSLGGGTLE